MSNRIADFEERDRVVLTIDLPKHGLKAGDLGTVVLVHAGGAGFEVEFLTLDGQTIDVVTLDQSQARSVARAEIAHARKLAG